MPTSKAMVDAMLGAVTGSWLTLRVLTTPSPSHRAQVGKFGAYYSKGYQVCMADCTKQMAEQKPAEPLTGDLWAFAEIIIQRPKTTKRVRPNGDGDNYVKCPFDAAKHAGVWEDDGNVIFHAALKRWTTPGETPGINLLIGTLA